MSIDPSSSSLIESSSPGEGTGLGNHNPELLMIKFSRRSSSSFVKSKKFLLIPSELPELTSLSDAGAPSELPELTSLSDAGEPSELPELTSLSDTGTPSTTPKVTASSDARTPSKLPELTASSGTGFTYK